MMKISVVCGSRARDKTLLLNFLKMLELQTFTDFDVNIVCDRKFTKSEELDFISFFLLIGLKFKQIKFFVNSNIDKTANDLKN